MEICVVVVSIKINKTVSTEYETQILIVCGLEMTETNTKSKSIKYNASERFHV